MSKRVASISLVFLFSTFCVPEPAVFASLSNGDSKVALSSSRGKKRQRVEGEASSSVKLTASALDKRFSQNLLILIMKFLSQEEIGYLRRASKTLNIDLTNHAELRLGRTDALIVGPGTSPEVLVKSLHGRLHLAGFPSLTVEAIKALKRVERATLVRLMDVTGFKDLKHLKDLIINFGNFSESAAEPFRRYLVDSKLKRLEIHDPTAIDMAEGGSVIAEIPALAPELVALDLCEIPLTGKGVKSLQQALLKNTQLRELRLNKITEDPFSDGGLDGIFDALRDRNQPLEILYVEDMRIGELAVGALVRLLKSDSVKGLKVLVLSSAELGDSEEGLDGVFDALRDRKEPLETLDIGNMRIKELAHSALTRFLSSDSAKGLKRLGLWSVGLGNLGLAEFVKYVPESVSVINLGGNEFEEAGVAEIFEWLTKKRGACLKLEDGLTFEVLSKVIQKYGKGLDGNRLIVNAYVFTPEEKRKLLEVSKTFGIVLDWGWRECTDSI